MPFPPVAVRWQHLVEEVPLKHHQPPAQRGHQGGGLARLHAPAVQWTAVRYVVQRQAAAVGLQ